MAADEENWREIERHMNIHRLKHEAAELAGGVMSTSESSPCPPKITEQFWQNVVAYEHAAWTTHFRQLSDAGIELPAPDEMDDAGLGTKLWEIIHWLAARRVFLYNTNHLSDRELYSKLWSEALREHVKDMPPHPDAAHHIDLIGSGSEEDIHLNLKFYAGEEERLHWVTMFPEDKLPAREDPPYDRDRICRRRRMVRLRKTLGKTMTSMNRMNPGRSLKSEAESLTTAAIC